MNYSYLLDINLSIIHVAEYSLLTYLSSCSELSTLVLACNPCNNEVSKCLISLYNKRRRNTEPKNALNFYYTNKILLY